MSQWTFAELREGAAGETLTDAPADFAARGVVIDSRIVEAGQVFLCLRGDRTDGHEYIEQAQAAGAAALVVEKQWADRNHAPAGMPAIVVEDGLTALQSLARFHRRRIKATVLGVTGSNGKTSTKEMLAGIGGALVGAEKVFATHGNLNNHIGLPLSVLAISETHELAILEMGMNHAGEIALLSGIARPHHALITSVSGAHQEYFDSVEDIARAKLEILEGVESGGTLVYHLYSPGAQYALDLVRRRLSPDGKDGIQVLFFGGWPDDGGLTKPWPFLSESLDALLFDDRLSMMERVQVDRTGVDFVWQGGRVHCPHYFSFEMAENLLGALTLLEMAGYFPDQLREASASARPLTERRFQVIAGRADRPLGLLVDDSYNANPGSYIASLRSLRELLPEGRLALFAGEMAELGDSAREGHERVGKAAADHGFDLVVACGGELAGALESAFQEKSNAGRAIRVKNADELTGRVAEILAAGHFDGALVKGSRSARMDLVSDALRSQELV